MIVYELDKIEHRVAPPTPRAIEHLRQRQLEALKALRRQLLTVVDYRRPTA
jgi:hypothetical protein